MVLWLLGTANNAHCGPCAKEELRQGTPGFRKGAEGFAGLQKQQIEPLPILAIAP